MTVTHITQRHRPGAAAGADVVDDGPLLRRGPARAFGGLGGRPSSLVGDRGLRAVQGACVEALPHTPLARSCLARYERATLELFSGNSDAPLPAAMKQKLEALRRKAR